MKSLYKKDEASNFFVLQRDGVTYQWCFSFKFVIKFKSKQTIIRTIQEAENLLVKWQNNESCSSRQITQQKGIVDIKAGSVTSADPSKVRRSSLIALHQSKSYL